MPPSNSNADRPAAPSPDPKRPRRLVGSSDRIALNVGGERFVTTSATLTSHSSYFAALLSDAWIAGHDGDELFLDQDPGAFRKLLAYMRCGIVRVEDADATLLLLAEFLGVEPLLTAAKARWFVNIGRGPVPGCHDDASLAAAFDEVHGGIAKAVTLGLHPMFLRRDDANAEKEYASVQVMNDSRTNWETLEELLGEAAQVTLGDGSQPDCWGGLVGMLNGLHRHGYTTHERHLSLENVPVIERVLRTSFSRTKHSAIVRADDEIFVDEKEARKETKQFAAMFAVQHGADRIVVPSDFSNDADVRENPFHAHVLQERQEWLERNGFVNREEEFEKHFEGALRCMEKHVSDVRDAAYEPNAQVSDVQGRIYSRMVPSV